MVVMTKDEALRLALEALEWQDGNDVYGLERTTNKAITAIKAALEAKDEPVKVAHRHEWFRTGEMKVGQMRCISCGTWAEEEMPQRTWVGLTDEEVWECYSSQGSIFYRAVEAKLKEKNT